MPPPSDRIILPQRAWLNSSASRASTGVASRWSPAISSAVAGPPGRAPPQGAARAIGQHRPRVHRFADVVGVRDHAEDIDRDGNGEMIGDGVGAVSGPDIDA